MSDLSAPIPASVPNEVKPGAASNGKTSSPTKERPIRLWPAVAIVVFMWIASQAPRYIAPESMMVFTATLFAPMVAVLAFVGWWLFASRLRWSERGLGLVAYLAVGANAYFTYHPTIGVFGVLMWALPLSLTTWTLWLIASRYFFSPLVRRVGLVAVFALTWGYFSLIKFDGVDGSFNPSTSWRWSVTAEDRLLAEKRPVAAAQDDGATAEPSQLEPSDWPEFRGINRDGRRTGERIATDWAQRPPREVWRHRIGPGWSSFAVVGSRLYTQEQRGPDEYVMCYDADTGEERWGHADRARFTEPVAGPGPRATPTFHEGKIYALGAAGRLNCLDAVTGNLNWSHDITADAETLPPMWGFAASPLVCQGIVSVFAGGKNKAGAKGKSVLGYDAASGDLVWSAGQGGDSYCSTQRVTIAGQEQLVVATGEGLIALEPKKGEVLWQHEWKLDEGMARVIQPTIVAGDDLLLGMGFSYGTQRVHVSRAAKEWTTEEVWTSRAIKPYFNDLVVQGEYVYGFDNNFLTSVRLEDGKGTWKVRGYGNGQVLLLPEQGLLLVLSEQGDVALVAANPQKHEELGNFKALEGKTWNHPVVARGRLYVRNGEEAAAFDVGEH